MVAECVKDFNVPNFQNDHRNGMSSGVQNNSFSSLKDLKKTLKCLSSLLANFNDRECY